MTKLSRIAFEHRRLILVLAVLFCGLAAVLGGDLSTRLSAGGYEVPEAESATVQRVLRHDLNMGDPNLVFVVRTPAGPDDADTERRAVGLVRKLAAEPGVADVSSYWTHGRLPALRATSGDSALVLVRLAGDEDDVARRYLALKPTYTERYDGLSLLVGGRAVADAEMNEQTQKDLLLAEMIVLPATLLLLLLIFRGVVAAALPLALGVLSIFGTILVLRALVSVVDVSVLAMNLTTVLGLGLGIDYSLLMVTRFRAEMRATADTRTALATTMRTAGRTVVFSAVTVAVSLAGLLIFPMYFLRSFAYAGIAVALLAMLAAITVLPALLAALGPRVDKWSIRRRPTPQVEQLFWYRAARRIMARPVPWMLTTLLLLVALGAPVLGLRLGFPDERSLPRNAISAQVRAELNAHYAVRESQKLQVVGQSVDVNGQRGAIDSYARDLSRLPGVDRVDALAGSYRGGELVRSAAPGTATAHARGQTTVLSVVPSVDPFGAEGRRLVEAVRAAPAPFKVGVTGQAVTLYDTVASLMDRLPVAIGIIALGLFVLLFLLTGSVVMPLKALLLNLLSLSATFGVMVWVFQYGHLTSLFGDPEVTGTIAVGVPILVFCAAFGLSMDYEVFLLSRIKEDFDATGDNAGAVARGLGRTGGLVSAAALLMATVFIAFAFSKVTQVKLVGVGLTLAVILDVTVIRGILVPTFMRVAGRFNWWSPAPLQRLHQRFGLRESDEPPQPKAAAVVPGARSRMENTV